MTFPAGQFGLEAEGRDVTVAYADVGKGAQTLLFVHGLGSNVHAWDEVLPFFAEKYRCVLVDLPGYGLSIESACPGQMSFFAEVLRQFCDRLGLRNVHLIGHSMGGQISITLALQAPELVASLILCAPAGLETFTEKDRDFILRIFDVNVVRRLSPWHIRLNMFKNFYRIHPFARKLTSDRLKIMRGSHYPYFCQTLCHSVKGMLDQPVFARLPELRLPVLLIFGENDQYIPNPFLHPDLSTASVAETGWQQIPNARLELLPHSGHFVQADKPKEMAERTLVFLKEQ